MSMYLNSSNNSLFTSSSNINSSFNNSENFNPLRSKKQSSSRNTPKNNNDNNKINGKVKSTRRVLGDISNNAYTPGNNKTSKTSKKATTRKALGDISNHAHSKNNSSFGGKNNNLKSSKKVLTFNNSFQKPSSSSSFILEDRVNNTSKKNKSLSSLQKKKTIQETSIFVDNNDTQCENSNISKVNHGPTIDTKISKKYECNNDDNDSVSSIERPAGRMWHEQYFSDDDMDNFKIDVKEIKDDINEINSSFFSRQKTNFQEYEKELNKKMEEVLFSRDPYEEHDPFEDDFSDNDMKNPHPPSYFRDDDFDIDDIVLP